MEEKSADSHFTGSVMLRVGSVPPFVEFTKTHGINCSSALDLCLFFICIRPTSCNCGGQVRSS